jgi:hypothetical protein
MFDCLSMRIGLVWLTFLFSRTGQAAHESEARGKRPNLNLI